MQSNFLVLYRVLNKIFLNTNVFRVAVEFVYLANPMLLLLWAKMVIAVSSEAPPPTFDISDIKLCTSMASVGYWPPPRSMSEGGAFCFSTHAPAPVLAPTMFNALNSHPSRNFLHQGPHLFVYSPLEQCSLDTWWSNYVSIYEKKTDRKAYTGIYLHRMIHTI